MSRLIFINRFAWPDEPATGQLLTDLAEALAAGGREVIVIASRPRGSPRRETRRGVRYERVGSRRSRATHPAAKALDFAAFFWGGLARLAGQARRGDILIAMTDPPMLGAGAWAVARLRGARLVQWIQDIYPEIALALGGNPALRLLRGPRDLSWRRADACVTLGRDMAAVAAAAGVPASRLAVVPNWAPAGLARPAPERSRARRAAWGLEGKFVVAYSGNLGRVHDLASLLPAAARLRGEKRIVFLFIGGGARRATLEAEAAELQLPNVRFLPPQPREELAESLACADAHWVTLRAGCERLVFPSKLYGIAAIGRPVIFVGPPASEPARLVAEHGFGRIVPSGQPDALARAVRELAEDPDTCARLGQAAERFARESGGLAAAAAAWERILAAFADPSAHT